MTPRSAHIELEAERLVEDGVPREEARLRARKAFGNATQTAERYYESNRWALLTQRLQDVRYSVRELTAARTYAFAAMATLAIGIGANTAVFSLVEAALLRPFPYRDAGRLVAFHERFAKDGGDVSDNMAPANFANLRADAPSLEDAAAHYTTGAALVGPDFSEQIAGRLVSGNLFQLLGVNTQLGRTIVPADDDKSKPKVVVLSNELWKSRFYGDPSIVGQSIVLGGSPAIVLGVMPAGFRVPGAPLGRDQYWTPMLHDSKDWAQRSNHYLSGLGRLRAGAHVEHSSSGARFWGSPSRYGIRAIAASERICSRWPVLRSMRQMPLCSGAGSLMWGSATPWYPYPGRVTPRRLKSVDTAHLASGLKA